MELSLGLFFGNQGQIGQPLSEEISLLKCSSRSKQKILGLLPNFWVLVKILTLKTNLLQFFELET